LVTSFILKHTQSYIYLSATRSRFCGITHNFVNYGPVVVLNSSEFWVATIYFTFKYTILLRKQCRINRCITR